MENILPAGLSVDEVMAAAEDQMFGLGFCMECGAERDGCEPDARDYPCEECGENRATELILMGVGQ